MENQNQPRNTTESQLADLESVLGPMSMMQAKFDDEFIGALIDIDIDESEEENSEKKLQ